jgi:1-deoxy-D-xylulose-5-phosphate reductoisomerase
LGKSLEFDTISEDRYPCFYLARQAMKEGTIATNILNATNEVAVAAFLECRIPFTAISEIVEDVLNLGNFASELGQEPSCLEQLHVMDDLARKEADLIMKKRY